MFTKFERKFTQERVMTWLGRQRAVELKLVHERIEFHLNNKELSVARSLLNPDRSNRPILDYLLGFVCQVSIPVFHSFPTLLIQCLYIRMLVENKPASAPMRHIFPGKAVA